MSSGPTLLRELIDIPERIHEGDFVLKLSDGVARAGETLRSYVVTDQLRGAFDAALSLVRSAVESRASKGSLLHGSFGSGKSHFMAVLHQLLVHDPAARAIPELSAVVARHDVWMQGRKFLLVPYHMIGAKNLESAVLGGYTDYVKRLHPESTPPPVFLSAPLFENARSFRATLGDEAFFAKLNAVAKGGGGATGWGKLGPRWDAVSFERAATGGGEAPDRQRLVSDLVASLFPAYAAVATGSGAGFVSLDEGLAAISRHAKGLGYDAVVLFLDELILWLASNIGNLHFVETESAKLVKLVESGPHDRPAPIVSFVARQRDLKDLVGEHVAGAEKLSFGDALRYMKDRFGVIQLEDTNLPEIVEKRLLKPRDAEAAAQVDREFERTANARQEVLRVLLGREGDTGAFRRLYPFSPALVQTLVALSSALQRNRTALRLLQQLLVHQRDTLALGDLVPVGDLFDELEAGVDPFSHEMRTAHEEARKLYRQRFRPILLDRHKLNEEALASLAFADPRARGFRTDDRLVKTLLVAALVPEVEALKEMRAGRLAALNYGTIRAPIPGGEAQQVLAKCRSWAADEGALRIGDEGSDPTITLQVAGVDVEAILDKALGEDNEGNKRARLRELLFAEIAVNTNPTLLGQTLDFAWRGVKRPFELVFQNVREMSDAALRPDGNGWRVVFDFPFDVPPFRPADDMSRVERFVAENPPAQGVCWLPSFLGSRALSELGRLVRVEHVLSGGRLLEYTRDLSEVDRGAARGQLENLRSSLRARLRLDVEMAYGLRSDVDANRIPDPLDPADHLRPLDPSFAPRMTPGATLRESFEGLLKQALLHQFPAHPEFLEEVRPATCVKVLDATRRALEDPDGRLDVEPGPMRATLRDVAMPLKLGTSYTSHFIAGPHWSEFFERHLPKDGPVTVGHLRKALEQPPAMGLPPHVQDLVILFYAERAGKTVSFSTGPPAPAEIGRLADDYVLKDQPLPARDEWMSARGRAARIFGLTVPERCSAANVAALVSGVRALAGELAAAARELVPELETRTKDAGLAPEESERCRVARAAAQLVEALRRADDRTFVEALAGAPVPATAEALGASLRSGAETRRALAETHWEAFENLETDDIVKKLREALGRTENVVKLAPRLHELEGEAIRQKSRVPPRTSTHAQPSPVPAIPAPAPAGPVPPPSATPAAGGMTVVLSGERFGLDAGGFEDAAGAIRSALAKEPLARVSISFTIVKPSRET